MASEHQNGIHTGRCVKFDEGIERGVCWTVDAFELPKALLGGRAVAWDQRSWRSFSVRCA